MLFTADVGAFLFVLWLGICVELYPRPVANFLSLPTILSLIQVTVIGNQSTPKASFGAAYQFTFRY